MAPKRTAPRMPAPKVLAPMPAVIDHSRMLAIIGVCDDTAKLHNWIENAGKKREPIIGNAAFRRLVSISPAEEKGTVEHDFWQSIYALELVLSAENKKTTRLSRTRQKFKRVEVVQTLKDLAMSKKPSAGFAMLLDRDMPELTAEAVVLRHGVVFDEVVQSAARERLSGAGVDVSTLPTVPSL